MWIRIAPWVHKIPKIFRRNVVKMITKNDHDDCLNESFETVKDDYDGKMVSFRLEFQIEYLSKLCDEKDLVIKTQNDLIQSLKDQILIKFSYCSAIYTHPSKISRSRSQKRRRQ